MSQHLHLLNCVANTKSVSSPLVKSHTLDQYVQHINAKKTLSPKSLKTVLVYFICEADLPLSITKSTAFRALLELCNPAVTNILVLRASLTAHLTNFYFYHKESIRDYLLSNEINVSFTKDAWTSPNITAYLAVTAHYIDTELKLISIIIGLTEIKGNHLGASLATQFMNVLHQYNLDQKIICITTNNASVNNRMAQEIKAICPRFCSKANAVGCMAHTIHLAARNGLKALGTNSGDSINSTNEDNFNPISISSLVDPPDGLHLQYNSIISKISRLASYLYHSPQRQNKVVTTVNLIYEKNKPGNAKTLLSQVPTQWNSTYGMLKQALQEKDACNHFCTPEDLACYWLSPLEWQKAKVMVQFLEPLYKATLLICGSTYPTINQELPLYILLIKAIRQVSEQYDVAPMEPAA
ncbi:hypothetical protein O181_028458 [Austropuccinia psidii MF-1]|uniref:Uncharacterized protein n=1 Tax=Austropuccinia psidii MF-1 TaxID=1389203 RepID=A0A9Q3CTT8_9BASI|nr:hypothetical protein [Austropuccinia psidii MF-1]